MLLKARILLAFVFLAFFGPVSAELDSLDDPNPQLVKGMQAMDAGDIATSIEIFEPLAEKGSADAQFFLGQMYLHGIGVTPFYPKATKLLKQSAMQGLPGAQWLLGTMYASGKGVEPDADKSREWIGKAAQKGHRQALHDLAIIYEGDPMIYREDSPVALSTALFLFRKAAKQGYAPSKARIEAMQHYNPRLLKRIEKMADIRAELHAENCHEDANSKRGTDLEIKGCTTLYW